MIIVLAVLSFRQDAESSRFVAQKILQQPTTEFLISSPGFKASKSQGSIILAGSQVPRHDHGVCNAYLGSAPRELLHRPLEVKAFCTQHMVM